MANPVREKALRFGGTASLAGILTEPVDAAADAGGTGVVMINSGILHRVGACRLHVTLARRLAAQGVASLRFDLSGIGDSEARRDSLSFEKSAVIEIGEAMDSLAQRRGVERFVVLGLCSGADMAFESACQDERIAGLVMLDPWAYRTARYWLVHYGQRVGKLDVWRRFLGRLAARLRGRAPGAPSEAPGEDLDLPVYVREFPPRTQVAAALQRLLARDLRLLCVFSGGQEDFYNYPGQMRDAFRDVPLGDRLREVFLPEADHIFTDLALRGQVVELICRWIDSLDRGPAPVAGPQPSEGRAAAQAPVPQPS